MERGCEIRLGGDFLLVQSLQCPECGSKRIWKAGLRYSTSEEIQRYICRDCGFRFSDPKISRKNHISENEHTVSRQSASQKAR